MSKALNHPPLDSRVQRSLAILDDRAQDRLSAVGGHEVDGGNVVASVPFGYTHVMAAAAQDTTDPGVFEERCVSVSLNQDVRSEALDA